MITTLLMVGGGLLLLFAGGEMLVRGAVGVARRLGLSELIIGLTLVGFGTSVPELVTSLRAVETDAVGIAVGNVTGSNIANVFLVLGVAALLTPIVTHPAALWRDCSFMVLVTAVFAALVWLDLFTRPVGLAMVAVLVGFVVLSIILDLRSGSAVAQMHADEGASVETRDPLILALILALVGIAAVIFGARLLVDGSVVLARMAGLSETVIGLTIVAMGTSLPELVTSAMSALRGKSDVALGNIVGSNIFNILGILGITALVSPFSTLVPQPAARSPLSADGGQQGMVEVPIVSWEDMGALILSVGLLILFAFTGRRIARWEGLVFLGCYAVYMGLLFDLLPTPLSL